MATSRKRRRQHPIPDASTPDTGRELLSPTAAVLWILGVALVITLAIIFW